MEEAHRRRDFELPIEGEVPDYGVLEADIATADPRAEFEEEPVQGADIIVNVADDQVIITNEPVTENSQE